MASASSWESGKSRPWCEVCARKSISRFFLTRTMRILWPRRWKLPRLASMLWSLTGPRCRSIENVRQTREGVEALKAIRPSILVEGEIGDVGTGSEIHEDGAYAPQGLTSPDEARQFVEARESIFC